MSDIKEPFLVYPGSKWKLAPWIISHFPKHISYLEPFAGSIAVFLQKEKSPIEVLNDLDGDIVNLLRVIRDQTEDLLFSLELTPWSREEFELSYDRSNVSSVEQARRFVVNCWQSYGVKRAHSTGWKIDTKCNARKYYASSWKRIPERILAIVDRLRDAQIENRPAIEIIPRFKSDKVLIYADPPYMSSTRSRGLYKFEMNNMEHEILIKELLDHPGPVVLSGLHHPLYDHLLLSWKRVEQNSVIRSGASNTEVLWINPIAIMKLEDQCTITS